MKSFKIYRASAGSGKTYTIALKYITELIKNPYSYKHILAVTFTNDAAGEMKERILNELHGLILENKDKNHEQKNFLENLKKENEIENLSDEQIQKKAKIAYEMILDDYGNFNITTIDSFFQKILRNMAKELGINSQFDIEMDINLPIKDAVKAVIAKSVKNEKILTKIVGFLEHKLESEKWNIQRDLENFAVNIFKEAFQKREKNLQKQISNNPQQINNSIKECKIITNNFEVKMKEFAENFEEQDKSNFHYGEKGIISYFKKIKNGDFSEPNTYVKQVLNGEKCKIGDIQNMELLKETENFRLKNIEQYNSARLFLKHIHSLQLLEDISLQIENYNKEQNRFMLAKTNQLLNEIIDGSDTPFIYEKIGANIESIIIDEFQDTSTLQWENFKPMLKNILDNSKFGMLVGDVKQSIYRWRNGDWKILNEIDNDSDFAEKAEIKNLENNWRSAKNIVEFNNNLFGNISQNFEENIQKAYCDVKQQTNKNNNGFVSVDFVLSGKSGNTYETENGENLMINAIAEKLEILLKKGVEQRDICILCRKGEQINKIAENLSKIMKEKYTEIKESVKIISEEAYKFESSKEISMLISALKIINEQENPIYKAELMLKWEKIEVSRINKKEIDKLTEELLNPSEILNLPLYDLIIKLCDKFGFNKNAENSGFLFAFIERVLDFSLKNTNDIALFLEYWDEKLKNEALPMPMKKENARNGILAMTIHKSKGLEFHSVIIPFVDWATSEHSNPFKQNLLWCSGKNEIFDSEIVPVEYSQTAANSVFKKEYEAETIAQKMDNLNVLYVALTRAEKNLFIIAKQPSKNSGSETVQKLIYEYLKSSENFDANINHYEIGEIVISNKDTKHKINQEMQQISFNMHENLQKIKPNIDSEQIREGKIIHTIFENICVFDDIENAVKIAVSLGEVANEKEEYYIKKVKSYIENSGKDWFSGKYKVFNETDILSTEKVFRPDRVIIDEIENSAIIIDYKTGEKSKNHKKQIIEYANILQKMDYQKIQGFIWYLSENEIIEVKE